MKKLTHGVVSTSLVLFAYLIMTVFLSSFVATSNGENKSNVNKSSAYSESEIIQSDQEMRNMLEQARNADQGKSFADMFSQARTHVLFLAWILWLAFPFFLNRQTARSMYFWIGVLFVLGTGWLMFLTNAELIIFSVSICAGAMIREGWAASTSINKRNKRNKRNDKRDASLKPK